MEYEKMMVSLCATFEGWLIFDGDYPPLAKGQKVNLSFKMFCRDYEITGEELFVFEQIKHSEYKFSGKIIYKYYEKIVVDTLYFKFYIEINRDNTENIRVGQFIKGIGNIHVDYYGWVLNLKRYENPPNIFYNLAVESINEVIIAKKHLKSVPNGVRFPCSLQNDKYSDIDLKEVDEMDLEPVMVFYLLNLKEINKTVEKTFENKKLFRRYRRRKKINRLLYIISVKNIINKIICLYKWNKLKKLPDSYINDIFRSKKLHEIAIALAYSNQKIVNRFFDCSKLFYEEGILKLLLEDFLKQRLISKEFSNNMKARLLNISGLDDPDD